MLPDTKSGDYRALVVGTEGYADLDLESATVKYTNKYYSEKIFPLKGNTSIVADWINGGTLINQRDSIHANRLAILATMAAENKERLDITETVK